MTDYVLSAETRASLMRVSTASVATALYKRGLRNQFIQDVHRLNPQAVTGYVRGDAAHQVCSRRDRRLICRVRCNCGIPFHR